MHSGKTYWDVQHAKCKFISLNFFFSLNMSCEFLTVWIEFEWRVLGFVWYQDLSHLN